MTEENSMRVSQTIENLDMTNPYCGPWLRMVDVCALEDFDLDDWLLEIWMETYNV
jgi:hypothetical protein